MGTEIIEYGLYKTRDNAFNLSALISAASDEASTHFYILAAQRDIDANSDEGFASVWFNRSTGDTFFKNSELLNSTAVLKFDKTVLFEIQK
jgi:hypothetical protein